MNSRKTECNCHACAETPGSVCSANAWHLMRGICDTGACQVATHENTGKKHSCGCQVHMLQTGQAGLCCGGETRNSVFRSVTFYFCPCFLPVLSDREAQLSAIPRAPGEQRLNHLIGPPSQHETWGMQGKEKSRENHTQQFRERDRASGSARS